MTSYWERVEKNECTMSVCFNTSTSFEWAFVCDFFYVFFLPLSKAYLTTAYMCVQSDTNAMFIFVSDRSFLVAQLERYGIYIRMNVCKYNKHSRCEVGCEPQQCRERRKRTTDISPDNYLFYIETNNKISFRIWFLLISIAFGKKWSSF